MGSNKVLLEGKARSYAKKRALFVEMFKKTFGNITAACRASGLKRSTYYAYMEKNAEFRKKIEDLKKSFIDLAESKLYQKVTEGDFKAIRFFLINRDPEHWKPESQIIVSQAVVNKNGGGIDKDDRELQRELLGKLQRRFDL